MQYFFKDLDVLDPFLTKTVVNLNPGDPTGDGGKEQGSSQVDQGGRF